MRSAEVVPLVPVWALDRAFTYAIPDALDVQVGSLVRIPLGGRKVRGVVVATGEAPAPDDLEEVAGVVLPLPMAPAPMPDVLEAMALRYATVRGVVHDRVVPPRVRVTFESSTQRPAVSASVSGYPRIDELGDALERGTGGVWLLEASPSDDRGELIAWIAGRTAGQVLVCVPEVRWGSPVIDSLTERFPDLARLDSAAGDVVRSQGWVALAAGHHLGVGGRGSVLAPAPRLGAVVIEDEANIAFKDDRNPRFDARWVAIERARAQGAACIFLTSAPSLVAAHAASEQDRWIRSSEQKRRAARPNVELAEPADDGFSRELRRAITSTLQDGSSVGLLVPQRGYARSMWCTECHRSVRCPRCEAGVIYERDRAAARCPRCTFTGRAPEVCPSCGAAGLLSLGAGSERLAEQMELSFPRARVRRVDPNVLAGLEEAPDLDDADIYVTTWIGTKAAIRPDVALVGVLDADTLIRRPHMSATEDAYLALSELARWAGAEGRLLIQTREPDHPAIQSVARADPAFFIERELPVRSDLYYPPFSETIRVRCRGDRWASVLDRVTELATSAGARVLGPVPVLTSEGTEVQEMLLKCPGALEVAAALRVILPDVPRGTTLRIDTDPR